MEVPLDDLEKGPAEAGINNDAYSTGHDEGGVSEANLAALKSPMMGSNFLEPRNSPITARDARMIRMSSISNYKILNKELFTSCASGNYDDVQTLLQNGAKPMPRRAKQNEFPLYITCRNGFFNILELLLHCLNDNGELLSSLKFVDNYGNSLFHITMKCITKRKEKASILNYTDHKKCMINILKYINLEKYTGIKFIKEKEHSLLLDACEEGLNDFVDRLLKDGADPTIYCKPREKKFAIHIACSKGYFDILELLIDRLKDLNDLEKGLQQKDTFGNTVIHAIVKGLEKEMKSARKSKTGNNGVQITNYIRCMSFLLPEYKDFVNIDAVNNVGNTALHTAVMLQRFHNQPLLVKILCDHGANWNIKNKEGKYAYIEQYSITPKEEEKIEIKGMRITSGCLKRANELYDACESCNLNKVKFYIENADCTIFLTEKEENTALSMAFSKGCFKIVDILVRKMKNNIDLNQVIPIIKKLSNNIKNQKELRSEDEEPNEIDYNKCLDILVEHYHLFTDVLYTACEIGDFNIVKKLIRKGAYPTLPLEQNREFCPILVAFKKGYYKIADILLKTTKQSSKHQEPIGENMVKYIVSIVIGGAFQEKENNGKQITKQEEKKGKVNNTMEHEVDLVNYEETFGVLFENLKIIDTNEILYDVCEKGLPCFVKKLLNFNVDPAKICKDKMENYPLIIAARKGHSDILEIILSHLDQNKLKHCLNQRTERYGHTALHVILRRDKENSTNDIEYMKCMDTLMKYKNYFDIDAKNKQLNTALHYAVRLRGDWTFAKTLIKNGACINIKNREHICVIDKIPVKTFEDILNECIEESSFSNERENDNYMIKLHFSIFSHMESLQTKSELELITALQNSVPHRRLLYHPLITSFIHIKWQKIRYIWYLNFLFNISFFFFILFYIFYYGRYLIITGVIDKSMENDILPLKIIITIQGSLLMVREIAQFIIFKWEYFKSFDNYLEVTILILTCIMLFAGNINVQHSIAAWLIVFITMEMILLFEKMHLLKMAIYISMFKKVTWNFVKLTILLSWMVLAFGVSFRLLFLNIKDTMGEEKENKFSTWNKAFLKILVMSTGEQDFSDFDFDHFPLASRLLFVVFIFSIILVAMNLLNGIAISDIQDIQNDASNYQIRDQIECIINFDQLKPVYRSLHCLYMWKNNQIFERCFPDKVVDSIHPNRHYSALWVRCKGHEDLHSYRFYFLRVYRWFKSLLKNIKDCQCVSCSSERIEQVQNPCTECKQIKNVLLRCSICGEEENVCKECQSKIQQEEHKCIYKHTYRIKTRFVTKVKQIKIKEERNKAKSEKKKTKEFHEKKLNNINIKIANLKRQQKINGNRLQDIEKTIQTTKSDITERLIRMENCLVSLSNKKENDESNIYNM